VVETETFVAPEPVTDSGKKLQVASVGKPEHDAEVKLTIPLKPSSAVTLSIKFPAEPRVTGMAKMTAPAPGHIGRAPTGAYSRAAYSARIRQSLAKFAAGLQVVVHMKNR
jgi:hypothetical protein